MTDSITMILEGAGYETACQNVLKDVVNNMASFAPDLIMLDVMFPDNCCAGFKLAREIRHRNEFRNVPILMLSGINERMLLSHGFSNGDIDDAWMPVNEFVDKPVNPRVLLDRVEALVNSRTN